MEAVISDLLKRFDTGTLTRRELIQGLAMLAAASSTASAAGSQEAGFKVAKIDHVSIQVSVVRLGMTKTLVSLHHKSPTGLVDHFAIGVDPFNKESVTRYLKQRGANPEENLDAGFHVKDPQGIGVQIVQA